ncbi:hypothetical protein AKJ40_01805 [candidate division MSBL1 archaeon SCGC-AAA259M10]|uniref:Cation transporter n=1 Tax=candidate division MSBL1 archaeon SCGC-AAA259M10 TaxID=1698270 RepID=A0A133V135_9EURY|nr:hypothetical protein AKJ40_01805 [candidate division MSBL1 archaeon SCGC-AAA259M10]
MRDLFAFIFLLIAGILLVPVLVAAIYMEFSHIPSFVLPAAISGGIGIIFRKKYDEEGNLRLGEAMLLVAIAWVLMSGFGAVPYIISLNLGPLNAMFESAAGFTATGLTILQGAEGWLVEVPPHSMLFWRSFTQWVGGVGVVVLFLAIIPRTGRFARLLFESEAREERMLPRIKDTARYIYKAYLLFTILGIIGFVLGGMGLFAAVNHSMTGIATGGFSVTADSFAGYGGPILAVAIFLMIMGAISFALHRKAFDGNWRALLNSWEVRLMIGLIALSALALALDVGIKNSIFQTTSALTGTGFSTTGLIPGDWSSFQKGVLTVLMVLGGGYGSTSSAIKLIRSIIIIGTLLWIIKRAFLPDRAIVPLKIGGVEYEEKDVMEASMYAFIYIGFLIVSSLLIMILMPDWSGIDVIFESASAQGNVGLSVGITEVAPSPVKWILIGQMLAGRLEILPYVALFYKITQKIGLH